MKKSRVHIFALASVCTMAIIGVMAPAFAGALHQAAAFAGHENIAMLSLAGTILATSGAQPVGTDYFDIDAIEDVPQADVKLRNPKTGMLTGAFITLMGPEHPSRKAIALSLMRRARAEAMNGGFKPKDPEEDISESIEMLVQITVGWSGIAQNGQLVPFSPAAASVLYGDKKRQWLVKQLLDAMNDRVLFIKA